MISNIVSCVVVTFSTNYWVMCIGRFMQGVTQTFFSVYMPIWTVNYAPTHLKNLFIGVLMGISPLGVIFGYLFTGFLGIINESTYMWRVGIAV